MVLDSPLVDAPPVPKRGLQGRGLAARLRSSLRGIALASCLSGLWLAALLPDTVPLIVGAVAWLTAPRRLDHWRVPAVLFPVAFMAWVFAVSFTRGTLIPDQFLIFFVVILPLLASISSGQRMPVNSLVALTSACVVATLIWPDQFGIADWRQAPYELNEIIIGNNAWVAVAVWYESRRGASRLIGCLLLAVLMVASWLQILPVGPILAGASALGIMIWRRRSRHQLLIRMAIVVGILIVSYVVGSTVSSEIGVEASNTASRWEVWQDTVSESSLTGSGQDPVISNGKDIDHAHNFLVDAFRLVGAPGALVMLAWTLYCFRNGRFLRRPILTGIVVAHLVSFSLIQSPSLWLAFAFLLGPSVASAAMDPDVDSTSDQPI